MHLFQIESTYNLELIRINYKNYNYNPIFLS